MKIMKMTARPWNNSGTEYTKGVGTLEKAAPVVSYLFIEEKLWTDKRRWSLWRMTAFFLLYSLILILHSMIMIVVWIINIHSEKERENKSSMKNFIESPSFPELSKQARKTNESKEWSIQDGQSLNQWPYIFNIAQNSKKLLWNLKKLTLLLCFSKTSKRQFFPAEDNINFDSRCLTGIPIFLMIVILNSKRDGRRTMKEEMKILWKSLKRDFKAGKIW